MPTKAKKAQKTLVIRDEATGLRLASDNKSFLIEDEEDAEIAIARTAEIQEKLDKLKLKMVGLEADKELARAGLNNYQVEHDIKEIKHNGWVSLLIERTKNMYIFTDADIPANLDMTELEEPVIPLFDIIKKKFPDVKKRMRVIAKLTRRVIDPSKLDDVVKSGLLTPDEILPAYLSYVDTSYVQVKPDTK